MGSGTFTFFIHFSILPQWIPEIVLFIIELCYITLYTSQDMSRQPRYDHPETKHHATSRGNNGEVVFRADRDKVAFLRILTEAASRFKWKVHAYCLMDNHFHLLLETPEANLSTGMQFLNGTYTQKHNHLYKRNGHLFQGRFWSNPIADTEHFLEVARYIALNPVRANLVRTPEIYPWSSFLETAGWREGPTFLNTSFLLSIFSEHTESARDMYLQFIYQGIGEKDKNGRKEMSISRIQDLKGCRRGSISEAIGIERPSLSELLPGFESRQDRNMRIRTAYLEYGYTLSEISESLGVKVTALSMMLRRFREKCELRK